MEKISLLVFLAVVLACGCIEQQGITTTTPQTSIAATTVPESTSTVLGATSTVEGVPSEYLSIDIRTINVTKVVSKIPECEGVHKSELTMCYFNQAIATNNQSICGFIESTTMRDFCYNETSVETGGKSSTIAGWVKMKATGKPVTGLQLRIFSTTYNKTIETVTTDLNGEFSVKVPARDLYKVKFNVSGTEYQRDVYTQKNWVHKLYFELF